MQNEHQIYMMAAQAISTASYCERAKVGCILVKGGNIISFGYNGTPRGFPNVCEVDGTTDPTTLHAESNAITKCAKDGTSCDGATMYCTMAPCFECAKLTIQAGISRVVYSEVYRDESGILLLKKAGVGLHPL